MNKIILTGRITKDPELKDTKNGSKFCGFSLAVYDGVRDGERQTQFIYCCAFGDSAESIARYCTKGDFLSVGGKLTIDSYTDEDNIKRYSASVIVQEFDLIPTLKQEKPEEEKPKKYSKNYKR